MNTNKLIDCLIKADESLTPDIWRQGSYFKLDNGKFCMCPHGAIQLQISNVAQHAYRDSVIPMVAPRAYWAAEYGYAKTRNISDNNQESIGKQVMQAWVSRPKWIQERSIYGTYDPHYLLGMVGLTVLFNDNPKTTFKMVKKKFQQAIDMARELDKYNEEEVCDVGA